MGERLSNFVVRHRSLTSLSLPLAKFKVPSSGWRRGLISIARLEGMVRGRERVVTLGRKGRGRRITFYDSPLFPLSNPPLHLRAGLYLAERPIRYVETPSNPLSRGPSNAKSFPPLLRRGGGGKTATRGGGGLGRTMPLHCTGWGSLLRARRAGDLGANARNRSVPSSPRRSAVSDTEGCNAPYDSPLLLLGARVHRQRARGAVTLPGRVDTVSIVGVRFSVFDSIAQVVRKSSKYWICC